MNKVTTMEEAVARVQDGSTIMMGGFGLCGIPEKAIQALVERGCRNLTIIANNAGVADAGIGLLVANGQVSRMIASYIGENPIMEKKMLDGEVEVELIPQGTLSERVRAGGSGIAGFYTPAGVATPVAEGKEVRSFNGREYILELALRADVAFIKAWKSDPHGNLVYRKTARNFNPMMATAADCTVAEVEEVVPLGSLDPESIVTPGIFVDMVVKGENYEKRIEKRVHRKACGAGA